MVPPPNVSTVKSDTLIEGNSKSESLDINEQAAELWQPQHYHLMRPDARLDNLRRFHSVEDSLYPLPADIQEQDRLEIQHVIVTHCFGGLFRMPIKDILSQPGSKVLDVGCGPGSWSRDVATEYPNCEVHAITLFVPLSMLVYEDIQREIEIRAREDGPLFKLKEFVVAVPEGYSRNAAIDVDEIVGRDAEDQKEWAKERNEEAHMWEEEGLFHHGARRVLPIVQVWLK
ncbi:hypothetical protein HK096_003852, partial [Nowakowskiella sp. JEL0078]